MRNVTKEDGIMGRFRKTARFFLSVGGYDGLSPIAKESSQERLLREQNELLSRQTRVMEERTAVPADEDVLGYYPVTVKGSPGVHLIYGDVPGAPTLCLLRDTEDIPRALSIDDVTCRGCRAIAGDYGGPPGDRSTLTGRCPKCSRPVIWYKETHRKPVHNETGEFECPPAAAGETAQDSGGLTAELERLIAMRDSGALDDEEFRAAKARIIHGE
jgi:Short C-terminal domain